MINDTIIPLVEKYGDQLQIIAIDVTQQQGQTLFLSAIQKFNLDSAGVPFLVIDDTYLIGSEDIPNKFPGLIETYLTQGGVDFPNITGLQEMISKAQEADNATAAASTQSETLQTQPVPATASPADVSPTAIPNIVIDHGRASTWLDTFTRDPAGNTLSVLVLIACSEPLYGR